MPKQQIQIEVDVPNGWEVDQVLVKDVEYEFSGPLYLDVEARVVLRKAYTPPAWLKPGTWLYESFGQWKACDDMPKVNSSGYLVSLGSISCMNKSLFLDFVPPPTNPYQIPEVKP